MGETSSERFTGLWVAVEAGVGRDPRVVSLAKALGIPVAFAVGHIVLLWGGVTEHAPTGDLTDVCDEVLELWATWDGESGRFASAFSERFIEDGQLRSWEKHNGRFLVKALKERERKRSARAQGVQGHSADIPRTVTGQSTVNRTEPDITNKQQGDSVSDLPAIQATKAINDAMASNSAIRDFHPLLPGPGVTTVGRWLTDGIPLDLILETVARLGRDFQPKGTSQQIGSLKYCDGAVRAAHAIAEEAEYEWYADEARRGMDMGDAKKYPRWEKHRPRYWGKEVTSGAV